MPSVDQKRPEAVPTPTPPPQIVSAELTVKILLDAIESMPDGLAYYDANDRLVLANSNMAKCYPILNDRYVVGTKFEDIVRAGVERQHPGPADCANEEWIQKLLAYHCDPKGVLEYKLNDGRYVRVTEIRSSNGGNIGVWTDITEIRNFEIALEESKKELENHVIELHASKSVLERHAVDTVELAENLAALSDRLQYEIDVKNRFFAIISHDLISPFNALLGMTQMMSEMADSFSNEKLIEYATSVNEVGTHVFELLQNLLEWSQLQIEGAKLEIESISLQDIVHENINILKPLALEKGIALKSHIKNTAAFADRVMVNSVIRNLIANALKFTPSGGSVEISSHKNEHMIQVTVTDNGVGMSKEQAEKVFALDQKTTTIGTAGEIGTGLGLPLCINMIERNGGKIWVESKPGAGSRFHFTLPIDPGGERPFIEPSECLNIDVV